MDSVLVTNAPDRAGQPQLLHGQRTVVGGVDQPVDTRAEQPAGVLAPGHVRQGEHAALVRAPDDGLALRGRDGRPGIGGLHRVDHELDVVRALGQPVVDVLLRRHARSQPGKVRRQVHLRAVAAGHGDHGARGPQIGRPGGRAGLPGGLVVTQVGTHGEDVEHVQLGGDTEARRVRARDALVVDVRVDQPRQQRPAPPVPPGVQNLTVPHARRHAIGNALLRIVARDGLDGVRRWAPRPGPRWAWCSGSSRARTS